MFVNFYKVVYLPGVDAQISKKINDVQERTILNRRKILAIYGTQRKQLRKESPKEIEA